MTREQIIAKLGFTLQDWELFKGCDRAMLYSTVPCSTRCWKRAAPMELVNGTCPECGKKWTPEQVEEWR